VDLARQPVRFAKANLCPSCLEPKRRIAEMQKSIKSKAEEQFAASQKKAKQVLKEKEKAQIEGAEKVMRLRALRLAKEAADLEAAEAAEAEKAAAKAIKTPKKSSSALKAE
jgi:hypothetical protein